MRFVWYSFDLKISMFPECLVRILVNWRLLELCTEESAMCCGSSSETHQSPKGWGLVGTGGEPNYGHEVSCCWILWSIGRLEQRFTHYPQRSPQTHLGLWENFAHFVTINQRGIHGGSGKGDLDYPVWWWVRTALFFYTGIPKYSKMGWLPCVWDLCETQCGRPLSHLVSVWCSV